MVEVSRYQIIKRLQTGMPRGAPFDLPTLRQFGVSPQLAARYADGGWLVRLAQGVYAFPNDDFGIEGALRFLQKQVPGFHAGGRTALAWQGMRHNLGSRETLVLWGDTRFALPGWFTERHPARYVHARLFDWPDAGLAERTVVTPPGMSEGCASPPRNVRHLRCFTKPVLSKVWRRRVTSSTFYVPLARTCSDNCYRAVPASRPFGFF